MAKDERAKWFKMFLHQKALIDSVPDETAGKALKAAFRYFDSKEMDDLDPLTFAVFSVIKPYIDESFSDYEKSVETGRSGAIKRWSKKGSASLSPPIAPLCHPIGVSTEAEAEAEAEAETGKSCCIPAASGNEHFIPPTADEIRAYCDNNHYTFDPAYFESYYRARGWRLGNVPMQDWKAVADSWQQKEKPPLATRKKLDPIPGVRTL